MQLSWSVLLLGVVASAQNSTNTTCPSICTAEYAPVCDTNGTTYGNKCEFDTAKCLKPSLQFRSIGECGAKCHVCNASKSWTVDIQCGSDGVSYSECSFDIAKCKNSSLTIARPGRCPCSPDVKCPDNGTPVCGSDGQEYSNYCQYEKALCKASPSLRFMRNSSCIRGSEEFCAEKFKMNTAEYHPVCGSDNKTYGNYGDFWAAMCRNPTLKLAKERPCGCDKTWTCYPMYPVCGSDKVTYVDNCEFEKAQCANPSLTAVKNEVCDVIDNQVNSTTPPNKTQPNTTQPQVPIAPSSAQALSITMASLVCAISTMLN